MKKKILFSIIAILALTMATSCGNKNLRQIYVDTNSMEPTLMEGSYAIEDTSIHDFTYGDIVTYFYTLNEYGTSYTGGRIIGLPGDTIEMQENVPIINGIKNQSKLINDRGSYIECKETLQNGVSYSTYTCHTLINVHYPTIIVPEGHYYIVGDSRDLAIDSRGLGAIPDKQITGKIVEII